MGRLAVLAGAPIVIVAVVAAPGITRADVIHLANGGAIQVAAWRDVGDSVEFAFGGGIIRVLKVDIQRIEGTSQKQDLRMYSAPATPATTTAAATPGGAPASGALKDMTDLLSQGQALFGQTVLSATEKAAAFRRLGERWGELSAPDRFREPYTRGQQALSVAAEAFAAEAAGTAPDTRERVEAAKKTVEEAQAELRKAAASDQG